MRLVEQGSGEIVPGGSVCSAQFGGQGGQPLSPAGACLVGLVPRAPLLADSSPGRC